MEQHDSSVDRFVRGGDKHEVSLGVGGSIKCTWKMWQKESHQTNMDEQMRHWKGSFDVWIVIYKVYEIQMYPIYVDGFGEMKMRMFKISNIILGGIGAAKCAAHVKTILFYT